MTNRFNLPDLNFLEKDPAVIEQEMLEHVSKKTGMTLQRADPRRKYLQVLTSIVSLERNRLEHALRQNRLAYANGATLDHMGEEMNTERLPAKAAITTMAFVLEPERVSTLTIPKGTLFLVGEDTYFATDEELLVPVGTNLVSIGATCTETGEKGNDYYPGEISTLVKPLPWVKEVQNTTISSSGMEEETDDAYAERIRLAPESFSVAGPELAYIYWAKSASQDIADVVADSPEEGKVDVRILMKDGRLPTTEELQLVNEALMDSSIRPLTDFVTVAPPTQVEYEAVVEYWIAKGNMTVASIIENQVNSAYQDYLKWQRSKMGRDVDLSELIARLKQAGASRVAVNSTMFIEIARTEVAKESVASLTYRGIADD